MPYEPGELKAVAFRDGKDLAEKSLKTTGAPAAIRLTADRNPIRADRNDLSYVTIEVVDEFGQVVTDADLTVNLSVSGSGELIGSGNAGPYDMESFGNAAVKTYRGRALAILRPYTKAGSITISVSCKNLPETVLNVSTK